MAKIPLLVQLRKSNGGYFVASVPQKRLAQLSNYRKKRWRYEDGWLILEAF